MNTEIRISSVLERSVAHGPGQRFVLWVQGCTLGCHGCFSPGTHPLDEGYVVEVNEMARRIMAVPGIEGVTFSGGEPILQAAGLAKLSTKLKTHGLTVMCYTGFTLEQLKARGEGVPDLLDNVDILVDGPFLPRQAGTLRWRGSRNQQIHFLSDTYDHLKKHTEQDTNVEFILHDSGFTATGVWPEGLLERLEEMVS